MNNRRLSIAVFHFVHTVERQLKTPQVDTKLFFSFSCQSKQVSRCSINFPLELTWQILTNQSIKIGQRAWLTRDYGEKSAKHLSSMPVFLNIWLTQSFEENIAFWIEDRYISCFHCTAFQLLLKLEKINERALRFMIRDKSTTYETLLKQRNLLSPLNQKNC